MSLNDHLKRLTNPEATPLLLGITRGLEKESLRVTDAGDLATSAHPTKLGSGLTHPSITMDFSEALLEFITEPSECISAIFCELDDIQRYAYHTLKGEILWVNSMPCRLSREEDIPLANFGHSNIGQMKHIYRKGLGYRYGRSMQTIAGVHYNFSVSDAFWQDIPQPSSVPLPLQEIKNQGYFGLIRNFRRQAWLLHYLLGATPAVCSSFTAGKEHDLIPFEGDTESLYSPFATSLRMGDLGYQSHAQSSLTINYNDMTSYASALRQALDQPFASYKAIGIKDRHNHYRQLNTHLLQIENEFYSSIRPKRTTVSGEPPLHALQERGIQYIEVRCLDLNPFSAYGIDATTVCFLDTFLLFCLLSDSSPSDVEQERAILYNHRMSIYQGRDPNILLRRNGADVSLRKWGQHILTAMRPLAELLDRAHQCENYTSALLTMESRLLDSQRTLSARVLEEMRTRGESYSAFGLRMSQQHAKHYREQRPADALLNKYRYLAEQSLREQKELETSDQMSFEHYLHNYYTQ